MQANFIQPNFQANFQAKPKAPLKGLHRNIALVETGLVRLRRPERFALRSEL